MFAQSEFLGAVDKTLYFLKHLLGLRLVWGSTTSLIKSPKGTMTTVLDLAVVAIRKSHIPRGALTKGGRVQAVVVAGNEKAVYFSI